MQSLFTPIRSYGLVAGLLISTFAFVAPVHAAQCGGDFSAFLNGVRKEAVAQGISANAARRTVANARIDKKVLSRDRSQGVFKQTFLEFSKRSISGYRMQNGAANMKKFSRTFSRANKEYGVPAPVITAVLGTGNGFWCRSGQLQYGQCAGDARP